MDGALFSELGGGVSNTVIRGESPSSRAVLKQSLGKLRVAHEWLSDRERIFREAAAMRWLEGKVRGGHVPRLLVEDRENFAIAMESAPASAEMWKTKLLRGDFEPSCAQAVGTMLGSIVSASWKNPEAERIFGDQTVFEQLRIDPYYRFTASRHPEIAGCFDALIARSAARRVSLVHGDWSPKNLLAGENQMWAIDWEVVHFGDPSYDVAFLLNHLMLKSVAAPQHRDRLAELAIIFFRSLQSELPSDAAWIETAALEHLPALLLARVDGKSPVEYLNSHQRGCAWELGLSLLHKPAQSVAEAFTR